MDDPVPSLHHGDELIFVGVDDLLVDAHPLERADEFVNVVEVGPLQVSADPFVDELIDRLSAVFCQLAHGDFVFCPGFILLGVMYGEPKHREVFRCRMREFELERAADDIFQRCVEKHDRGSEGIRFSRVG